MANVSVKQLIKLSACAALATSLSSCVNTAQTGRPNMATQINPGAIVERDRQIATEPTGDFFYARRYVVEKTRFWGYLRQPRQPWSEATLVIMDESRMLQPDRLPEDGPPHARMGYDNNYEYRITGQYTGRKIYEPSSNLFLPEFTATGYTRINTNPGWLFSPQDHYDPKRVTLLNKSVQVTR